MTTIRRALVPFALAAALAAPSARAQTKADAFAGKIPPVSGQLYQKAGRLELTLSGNLSLNDAFYTKLFGGLKLGYHLSDAWALTLQAAGGTTSTTGSAVVCSATTGCRDANETELQQVPGKIRAMGGLEVGWAPVYGKLNVLSEKVAHFDLSILGGVDAIVHDEVLSTTDAEILAATGGSPRSETSPGAHVGVGTRLFLGDAWALRLEVKDYVYWVEVPNNGAGKDWQNQIFTELGVSFFYPTRNRSTR